MKPSNRRGTPVDPVPFLVVCAFAFLLSFAFGPILSYEYGLRGPLVFVPPTVVFLAAVVVAYYRLVWTARPSLLGEVPAESRLVRLLYAVLVVFLLLGALSLPLLLR
ncbi:hypothetical protein ACFQPA_13310 [Halomarina halobia]|uniref:Tripartite tricarboxylate transporter TctB family protein n=1 Tax=Halomarina halobia TaxID=3033386 RepID=A0ABD6A8R7_9EURY|nr:hypothetical protein [Halomarina sp. PSR21]